MDMAFVVVAQYRVRAGDEAQVANALRNMVAPTRAEPGNVDYQVFRDPRDPSLFVLFERYTDESAFQARLASPHFGTWLKGQVLPSLVDRTRLDLVPLED
jgi:quinol monooxygenase YgiN